MPLPRPLSDEHLPDYTPAMADSAKLPLYTQKPHQEEYVLNHDIERPCMTKSGPMTYSNKDMSVTLGPRVWGFETPTYGRGGLVRGVVKLSDTVRASAWQICVSIVTTIAVQGLRRRRLSCEESHVYISSVDFPSPDEVLNFSVGIPCEVTVDNERCPSPPSLSISAALSKAVVAYEVVFILTKKGFFRTESSLHFPIIYLPKTFPPELPIKDIPPASSCGQPYSEEQGVHTELLAIDCPQPATSDVLPIEIFYSRPSAQSFASGTLIPIVLTIKNIPTGFAQVYLKELGAGISGTFQKRTRIANPLLREGYASEHKMLDYILAFTLRDIGCGVYQLHGTLAAGNEGCENSWRIPHAVEVQYAIIVRSNPKPGTTFSLPRFSHTDNVMLTTDQWGTDKYELKATSGRPVPAIGLYKSGTAIINEERVDLPENTDPNRYKITF